MTQDSKIAIERKYLLDKEIDDLTITCGAFAFIAFLVIGFFVLVLTYHGDTRFNWEFFVVISPFAVIISGLAITIHQRVRKRLYSKFGVEE